MLIGHAHVFGDFINTDEHASEKYKPAGTPVEIIQRDLFSAIRPGFSQQVAKGDFLVAGKGFGTVSSRVDAAINIKAIGIAAVLAQSFGILFYRNALNAGLPCIECDTSRISEGDRLEIDLDAGEISNLSNGEKLSFMPYPKVIQTILHDGGLLEHIRLHGGYAL